MNNVETIRYSFVNGFKLYNVIDVKLFGEYLVKPSITCYRFYVTIVSRLRVTWSTTLTDKIS